MAFIAPARVRYGETEGINSLALLVDSERATELLISPTHGVFVTGEYRGEASEVRYLSAFSGSLVDGVQIEIDEASARRDGQEPSLPLSLIRRGTALYLSGLERMQGRGLYPTLCLLQEDLPASAGGRGLVFTRWRIVLPMEGRDPIVLRSFDAVADQETDG